MFQTINIEPQPSTSTSNEVETIKIVVDDAEECSPRSGKLGPQNCFRRQNPHNCCLHKIPRLEEEIHLRLQQTASLVNLLKQN
ncbi:hypothetical protein QE152_g34316 [Popillia japonica]|uniref:Uncharacterized protein n=1 Tax=Popillia japonica TaxID=7064 RepID=A0AAW1ITU4_POPJA